MIFNDMNMALEKRGELPPPKAEDVHSPRATPQSPCSRSSVGQSYRLPIANFKNQEWDCMPNQIFCTTISLSSALCIYQFWLVYVSLEKCNEICSIRFQNAIASFGMYPYNIF